MRVLDLFSGIGGFSLGLERAGMKTIAFCETDEFCQRILKKRFPDVKQIGDMRGLPLSGSLDCWQASWIERREELIRFRADWVVIENVQHTWRKWVPELRGELWSRGYASLPLQLSAYEVGAPHLRKRCFIIANTNSELLRQFKGWWGREGWKSAAQFRQSWLNASGIPRVDDGVSRGVDRRKSIGNSVCPQVVELIGRGIMQVEKEVDIKNSLDITE